MRLIEKELALLIPLAVGIGGVFLGSKLTAARSHREFVRERTAQAYSIILEALFDLQNWFSVNLDDHLECREVDEATDKERREAYRAAKDRLDRTLAREEWLLPDRVQEVFTEMRKVFAARYEGWFEDLEESYAATKQARTKLISIARSHLGKPR